MGASAGIMMGASAMGNAYSQSQAMKSQGEYQAQIANTNAKLADIKSQDAIDRGNRSANLNDTQTKKLIGSQRAALAAQGIDVNSGSAVDVQSDSASLGALDSLTIRNNAWRESWGYKVESVNDTYSGKFSGMAADNSARNTLLTGGMQAAGSFAQAGYYYNKK